MSAPPLSRAVAASAAVHLSVLAALLGAAPPGVSRLPPMRVSLVETGKTSITSPGEAAAGSARREALELGTEAALPVSAAKPAPRAPTRPEPRGARRTESPPGPAVTGDSESPARAAAVVTPVQSDVWVLADSPSSGSGTAALPTRQGSGQAGPGTGGSAGVSLLAELSQRLAWSAERCAPATLVRAVRHAIPGVPLHFCLDAAGRPSDVGLLGTTGSDQLDRAARDCVVPGALPLPPAPGCYTVEVRFPTRG
ncbi:MAG TPA: hypothetical protein VLT82_07765 [Myxococcaceae bacterium]|nr:hypothetical protein [Myxococcaceae bacterium]